MESVGLSFSLSMITSLSFESYGWCRVGESWADPVCTVSNHVVAMVRHDVRAAWASLVLGPDVSILAEFTGRHNELSLFRLHCLLENRSARALYGALRGE